MEYEKQLSLLLEELEATTGIRMTIADTHLSQAETITRLQQLLGAWQPPDNRDAFLLRYFQGQLSAADIHAGIQRFHIEESALRVLFLLESFQPYTDIAHSVLSNLCSLGADTLIEVDERHMLLIRRLKSSVSQETLQHMAATMTDMLATESLCTFRIAFDTICSGFDELPSSYQNTAAAMKIGTIFYSSQRIYPYQSLDLGKLFIHLPREACIDYLQENLGGFDLRTLDEETLHTIRTFFDSNLSIAETARKLFLHRNTLIYRLDKLKKMTGLDIRNFQDAVTCKIAMLLNAYIFAAPLPISTT